MVLPRLLLVNVFLLVLAATRTATRVIDTDDSQLGSRDDDARKKVPFSLEETYLEKYSGYAFNGTWRTDSKIVYVSADTGNVLQFDVTTRRSSLLFDRSILSKFPESSFAISPEGERILIGYEPKGRFRHSVLRKYVVYNIEKRTYEPLADGKYLSLVKWSPIYDDLVYVLDNNIYYRSFAKDAPEIRKVTDDGIAETIFNGVPDWVYEEEVLHGASAIWFSPDGTRIAFMTTNDTEVKVMWYPYYGQPGSLENQYPVIGSIRYPKAGSPNPVVSLKVIDLTDPTSKAVTLKAPTEVLGREPVLYTVVWRNFDDVVAVWTNRVQNKGQMVSYGVDGRATKMLSLEESEGWLEIKAPFFHGRYAYFLTLQPSGTDAGRFLHLTRYQANEDGVLSEGIDLTPGPAEVENIVGIDQMNGRIYYLATASGKPSQRNLYSLPVDGNSEPNCISCGVLTPEGNNCTYVDAVFSALRSHYVLNCLGPDPATVYIFDSDNEKVYTWEDNQSIRRKLSKREVPIVINLNVQANGYESKVRLYLPHNFDETKSYPMLVNVYGGPNSARINDAAAYGFNSYMATNRSVIYTYIDGRGSSHKGSKMLFEIFRRLGTVEIEDQITVTRILQNTYSWIDRDRTAIWGWSYGGFATAMTLASDKASVFKCGISVAPVSSWIYYDSIYTERYMGLPTAADNLAGYNGTDVTRRVQGIRGKKFLLVHGTEDDNVHYQQSMALAKALEREDILFEQMTYPDEAHSLSGVTPHLYHTMDKFWEECLDLSRAQ